MADGDAQDLTRRLRRIEHKLDALIEAQGLKDDVERIEQERAQARRARRSAASGGAGAPA